MPKARSRKAAIADLRSAVELTRLNGDPALFLRVSARLLALDGDDALLAEAPAAAEAMRAALPDDEMRRRFAESEPVKFLENLR